jgi:hypothetical protein
MTRAIPLWLGLLLSASCAGPMADADWAGTVEELPDGRVRVSNPREGVWSEEERWVLRPTLRIGALEGDPAYLFGTIIDVDAGADGRIYVLDLQANELRIFDSTGVHLSTSGAAGEGPGEFARASGIEWLPGDTLLVVDGQGRRYSLLTADGAFARSTARPLASYGYAFVGGVVGGQLLETDLRRVGGEFEMVLLRMRLGPEAEVLDTLTLPTRPGTPDRTYRIATGRGTSFIAVPFISNDYWTIVPDGSLWVGDSGTYRLHRILEGDTLREVSVADDPIPVTADDIAAWQSEPFVEAFVANGWEPDLSLIPETKPFFSGLFVDPDGYLWVDVSGAEGSTEFDVFDPEGRRLGRIAAPVQRAPGVSPVVRGSKLYMSAVDEADVPFVQVLQIERDARR